MVSTIRKFDVSAAFRIGAVVYAILAAVFGLCGVLFQGAALAVILGGTGYSTGSGFSSSDAAAVRGIGSAVGIGSLCIGYLIGVGAAAVFGGIFAALTAFVYNLAARWVGGLKVELDRSSEDPYDPDSWAFDEPKSKRPLRPLDE